MKRGVTIKDLAKEAGVSITTVSQVLNQKPCRVSDETRERIIRLAEKHHYFPNGAAKSLVTAKTQTLGFLIPDITNPFFVGVARGIEDYAREHEYNVIFCSTDDLQARENQSLRMMMERGVDGLIIAHTADKSDGKTLLPRLSIPTVMIDREYNLPDQENQLGHVLVDNKNGAKEAIRYLLASGKKQIALLGGPEQASSAKDRKTGYIEALTETGLAINERLISSGSYTQDSGLAQMENLLKSGEDFDALFCANDLIAMGAIRVLKQNGLSVPRDKAVVGFDDNSFAAVSSPSLTTVRQPQYEMGQKACEILLNALNRSESRNTDPLRIVLPTTLIVRESA